MKADTGFRDLQAQLERLRPVLPDEKDVADLLRRIQGMATQSNLTIRGFEPQAVASRDLKSIDLGKANIAVVRYDTTFAHKAAAVETVTLSFEDGTWAVTAYSVK